MTSPWHDPNASPAGIRVRELTVDLCGTLALLTGSDPWAWRRCRAVALQYLHALRATEGGRDAFAARALLRGLTRAWAAPELSPAARARLEARCDFWVGTVHGLRWQVASNARVAAAPPALTHVGAHVGCDASGCDAAELWTGPPAPGAWDAMRTWRLQLAEHRECLRRRRQVQRAATDRARMLRLTVPAMTDTPRTPRLGRDVTRPTDDEILALARRIRAAVHRPPGEGTDDVLALSHELCGEDESRIETALEHLIGDDPDAMRRDDDHARRPRDPDETMP